MASLRCLSGVLLLITTSSLCTSESSNPSGSPTTVTTAVEGSGTLSSGKTSQADSLNVQAVARAVRASPHALGVTSTENNTWHISQVLLESGEISVFLH